MPDLALFGGPKAVSVTPKLYSSIGLEERNAVNRVLDSGTLSNFLGVWGPGFDGGSEVRDLESLWSEKFRIRHAISMNSATSGLFAAVGAIGIEPGDEVIVPPYTMSATVMAPLVYGGIPVFVDIEPETYCIDIDAVAREINSKTKAIIAVNLYGHPARLSELRRLSDKHNLKLIEDNAQGPTAMEGDDYAGCIGHIGVFSLNYHKHIHAGEGGICVTNDDDLAIRLRMIRNHGENAVGPAGVQDLKNLLGFNYRLTELGAAIGIAQLKHIEKHVEPRVLQAETLTAAVKGMDGFTAPVVRKGCKHVYYGWAARFDESVVGVSRELFSKALQAEGFPNSVGYVAPLYKLPIFQQRICIGSKGYPFSLSERDYLKVHCDVTERLHTKELICFPNCAYEVSEQQTKQFANALQKVYENRHKLKDWASKGELLEVVPSI